MVSKPIGQHVEIKITACFLCLMFKKRRWIHIGGSSKNTNIIDWHIDSGVLKVFVDEELRDIILLSNL